MRIYLTRWMVGAGRVERFGWLGAARSRVQRFESIAKEGGSLRGTKEGREEGRKEGKARPRSRFRGPQIFGMKRISPRRDFLLCNKAKVEKEREREREREKGFLNRAQRRGFWSRCKISSRSSRSSRGEWRSSTRLPCILWLGHGGEDHPFDIYIHIYVCVCVYEYT